MGTEENGIHKLDRAESWAKLESQALGRLVTSVGDHMDIFPINYVIDGESIVFRTAEGNKLSELTINQHVLFEADHFDDDAAWSVVVHGTAARLEDDEEIKSAEELMLEPMIPTMKRNFVKITPAKITARSFARGGEPEREGVYTEF